MPILTLEELRQLAAHEGRLCVSMYIPCHGTTPEAEQDRRHLKNRLTEADRLLEVRGLNSSADRRRVLERGWALVDDSAFWRNQKQGLGILLDEPGVFREFRVPFAVEELTLIGPRFQLTPILPAVENGGEFYVIAVSRNGVRLLHGTRYHMEEPGLPGVPQGVGSLGFDDDFADQFQFHSVGSPQGGRQAVVFHGQAATDRPQTERVMEYLRLVDEGVRKALAGRSAPLVFAGDVGLFPFYRDANQYERLEPEYVAGNPEIWTLPELHRRAWPIVQEKLDAERDRARAAVEESVGRGRGSHELGEVVRAAQDGRVRFLLVAAGRHVWGQYQPPSATVTVRQDRDWDSEDLINVCVLLTVRCAGRVFELPPADMPRGAAVAAAFRY